MNISKPMNNFCKPAFKFVVIIFFLIAQPAASHSSSMTACSILCTEAQSRLEELALSVKEMPVVRNQLELSRKIYSEDPIAKTEDGEATLDAALASISMAMLQWGVNDDSARPNLFWVTTAAHTWMGHDFPNSGYGIENPDNVYRHAPIDGLSRYEIRGVMPKNPPAQQSFTLYATLPGMGEVNREGAMILGALDNVVTEPDGSFLVTIDREKAAGRPNHIQSGEQTALLIVRDTLTDWRTHTPVKLSIQRVDGPQPGPAHDQENMAQRTAWMIDRAVPFWAKYNNELIYKRRSANAISTPKRRAGGWGFGLSGHFKLTGEQALVVTLDPKGSDYLGFQLADPWGVGLEYVHRSGSLNSTQVIPNKDATITYVISAKDPGVHNWLDTNGLKQGIFAIRWQGVPEHITSGVGMVRNVKVVKLAELFKFLPANTTIITPSERTLLMKRRKLSFERRLRE